MHVTRKISFVYGVAALIFSCNTPDQAGDQEKLLKIHDDQRAFHFGKNAKAMVEQFSPEMISVNRGKINNATPAEQDIARFQAYFNSVEFKKWDDVNPPEVRFSDDHTLAYMVIDKLVVLEEKDSVGNPFEGTTHFAWVSIFRKQKDGNWKLECVASTNEQKVVKKVDALIR